MQRLASRFTGRTPKTDGTHIPMGAGAHLRRPSSERPALADSDEHRMTVPVEAERLRLIQQRLQSEFYEVPPASQRIAASVLADLNDSEGSASVFPQ
jgi:hypothetical protein